MKVLLLNPPAKRTVLRDKYCCSSSKANYIWPPIDLLVLSGILHQRYDLSVIDAIAERLNRETVFKRYLDFLPDIVIFLTGSATWIEDINFIELLKKENPVTTVAIGGNLLTVGQEIMMRYKQIDAVLLDFTSHQIIDFIEGKRHLPIKSMIVRSGDKILKGDLDLQQKQFSYPIPQHNIFPLKKYKFPLAKNFPFVNIITDFGCPYNCRFCICEVIPYRKRDLGNIYDELDYIKKLGIPELFITDFSFGVNKEHSLSLCKTMVDKKYGFSWSCQSRIDINKELLSIMKKAGCHTIQFGVESGSQNTLDRYGKQIRKEQILETFKFCRQISIRTSGYFIFGLPGEAIKDLQATIDFALELNPDFASFSIAMPREGTSLSRDLRENGLVEKKFIETDTSSYPVFETNNLPASIVWNYRNRAMRNFYIRPSYIARRLFNIDSPQELKTYIQQAIAILKTAYKKNA